MISKGVFNSIWQDTKPIEYNGTLTEKEFDDFFKTDFSPKQPAVQVWGDTAEYILAMPDEAFKTIIKMDSIEIFVNMEQLKRFKDRVKALGLEAKQDKELKKYGK
jgi:hypothetical protein